MRRSGYTAEIRKRAPGAAAVTAIPACPATQSCITAANVAGTAAPTTATRSLPRAHPHYVQTAGGSGSVKCRATRNGGDGQWLSLTICVNIWSLQQPAASLGRAARCRGHCLLSPSCGGSDAGSLPWYSTLAAAPASPCHR